MRKRIVGLLLAVAIAAAFAPCAFAQTISGWCGDNVRWELRNNYTLVLSGTGDMNDYSDSITPWFDYERNIENLIIENGVTNIGISAFNGLINLENAEIADSVIEIGENSFDRCRALYNLKMSRNVERINTYAFYGCRNLDSIMLPETLTYIGERAFMHCENISEIIIPDNVTVIEKEAFYGCNLLTEVMIPEGVTHIGESAFAGGQMLNIYVDENNEKYSSVDGVLFNKEATELIMYSKSGERPEYVIPDSVTSIACGAFSGGKFLTNLTINKNITSIGDRAFLHCRKLNISVDASNPDYSDIDGVLFNKNKTKIIAYGKDEMNSEYTIPDSVTEINSYVFYYNYNLQRVKIPSHVTLIGDHAFEGCENLKEIELPQRITKIGAFTFADCEDLKVLIIPDGVEEIGEFVFSFCSNMGTVFIPASVKLIKRRAFGGMSPKIYYEGTQADWENIEIEDGNYGLETNIHYGSAQIPKPSVLSATVTESEYFGDKMYYFKVSLENIPYDCCIAAALYKDGVLVGMSSEMVWAQETEKNIAVEIDSAQNVDKTTVFIFDDLYSLKPLCSAKDAEFIAEE